VLLPDDDDENSLSFRLVAVNLSGLLMHNSLYAQIFRSRSGEWVRLPGMEFSPSGLPCKWFDTHYTTDDS
jgi:hypothetical protein